MAERAYSKAIASAIDGFLTGDDWHYTFDDEKGLFRFNLTLTKKIKKVSYIVDIKKDGFLVYAIPPLGAEEGDSNMMAQMAEFVCRANYALINGNFELDMRDGEIRYKTYVNCDGQLPTTEIIKDSIYCPAFMFEKYSAGITGIIFGDMTAKQAIDLCEK